MKPDEDFPQGGFQLLRPETCLHPFIFNSPHSGSHYPERFLAMSKLGAHSIRRSEDCYVDEIFSAVVGLGAPFLKALFPRAFLDVNREPFELDPRMFREPVPPQTNIRSIRVAGGLGTVPRLVGEGQEIYPSRISLREALYRIEHFYMPYHAMLHELMNETRAGFDHAILIDCHSMPAGIRVGDGEIRPDFIVGDRFGASADPELTRMAISILRDLGYSVAHNRPYAGGFITEHFGRPRENLHALQIEINRGLYLQERSYERTDGFAALVANMGKFSAQLMDQWDEWRSAIPLAAE